MSSCNHKTLALLPGKRSKLRCRRCHLTINPEDVEKGYCPECFEASGMKVYDFEEVEPESSGTMRYRCEDCGDIIESE